jgi:large subunit ribosomal protein L9
MEIILKTDVPKLGKALEIVTVKDGYARNYLFPQKMAILASKEAKQMVLENKAKLEAMFQKERSAAEAQVAELENASIELARKVVEDEKLYGSVTAGDVADALKAKGFRVEKRQIQLEESIKQLGVYTVVVRLVAGVEARVKVWVVAEEA